MICLFLLALHVSFKREVQWTGNPKPGKKTTPKPIQAAERRVKNSIRIEWKGNCVKMIMLASCLVSVGISERDTGDDKRRTLHAHHFDMISEVL